MGLQRLTIDLYSTHDTVVEEARNVLKYLADTGKGLTASAASVTNHPGQTDESTTDLLAPAPAPAAAPAAGASSEAP